VSSLRSRLDRLQALADRRSPVTEDSTYYHDLLREKLDRMAECSRAQGVQPREPEPGEVEALTQRLFALVGRGDRR
jgi:hypothetical protein